MPLAVSERQRRNSEIVDEAVAELGIRGSLGTANSVQRIAFRDWRDGSVGEPGVIPFAIEKAPRKQGFFCFHLISSEYQIQRINLPTFFGSYAAEVVWNEWELLWCGGWGLDNFLQPAASSQQPAASESASQRVIGCGDGRGAGVER